MPKLQVFFCKLQEQIQPNLYYFAFFFSLHEKWAQTFVRAHFLTKLSSLSAAAIIAAAAAAPVIVVAAATAAEQNDDQDDNPQTTAAAIVIPAPHNEYLPQL